MLGVSIGKRACLESLVDEAVSKHAKEVEKSQKHLSPECDEREHHPAKDVHVVDRREQDYRNYVAYQQRLNSLEQLVDDSAERQTKILEQALKQFSEEHVQFSNDKDKQFGAVEQRLRSVEMLIANVAEKHAMHAQQVELIHKLMQGFHGHIANEKENSDLHWSSALQRLTHIERSMTEAEERHTFFEAVAAKVQQRMNHFDSVIETYSEKQSKQAHALDLASQKLDAAGQFQSKLREQVEELSTFVAESSISYKRLTQELEGAKEKSDALSARLGTLDGRLGDELRGFGDAYRLLQELRNCVQDSKAQIIAEKAARETAAASIDHRVKILEKSAADFADFENQSGKDFADTRDKYSDLNARINDYIGQHAGAQQRLTLLEHCTGKSSDKMAKELEATNTHVQELYEHVDKMCEEHSEGYASALQRIEHIEAVMFWSSSEMNALREQLDATEQRVEYLACKVCANKYAKELEVASVVAHEQLDVTARVSAVVEELKVRDKRAASTPETCTPLSGFASISRHELSPNATFPVLPAHALSTDDQPKPDPINNNRKTLVHDSTSCAERRETSLTIHGGQTYSEITRSSEPAHYITDLSAPSSVPESTLSTCTIPAQTRLAVQKRLKCSAVHQPALSS